MKKKFYIYTAGAALCTLLFCISMFQVISHYASAEKSTNEFTELAEIVEQAEETDENGGTGETPEEPAEERTSPRLPNIRSFSTRTTIWRVGFPLTGRISTTW